MSGSAWKDKQVECVFACGVVVDVCVCVCVCVCACVVCCPVGSSKHSLMAQLCLSDRNSQNPLTVSLCADFAAS